MQITPQEFNQEIEEFKERMKKQASEIVGRQVRIISDYNGQSYGSSRKSQKGKIHKIAATRLSMDSGLIILIEGYEYGCPFLTVDEWEFV